MQIKNKFLLTMLLLQPCMLIRGSVKEDINEALKCFFSDDKTREKATSGLLMTTLVVGSVAFLNKMYQDYLSYETKKIELETAKIKRDEAESQNVLTMLKIYEKSPEEPKDLDIDKITGEDHLTVVLNRLSSRQKQFFKEKASLSEQAKEKFEELSQQHKEAHGYNNENENETPAAFWPNK